MGVDHRGAWYRDRKLLDGSSVLEGEGAFAWELWRNYSKQRPIFRLIGPIRVDTKPFTVTRIAMTIDKMISRLEEYKNEFGGETEVKLMTQESWPFENRIKGLCSQQEMIDASESEDASEEADDESEDCIYIVEGGQISYGSKLAWEAAY
jgi:hypothetical protein